MWYHCINFDRAAVSNNSPPADYISCKVNDNNRQYLPDTETSETCFPKLPEHLQTHVFCRLHCDHRLLKHNWIRTRCTSACGLRSCRASSLKSESLCSSFFRSGSQKSWAQFREASVQNSSFGRWRIEKVKSCGATKTSMLSWIGKESCPKCSLR